MTTAIPYKAQRYISRYSPVLRHRIRINLQERMRDDRKPTWDDLFSAIDEAMTEFQQKPDIEPDPVTVSTAIQQHRDGDCLSTEDYLNDINSRLAASRKRETVG